MAELWDVYDKNGNKTGRLHERGTALPDGDYHLVVHIWLVNARGEFLITKRAAEIPFAGYWQATGGSAVAGDDSITAALRETQEEIGVTLPADEGIHVMRYNRSDCMTDVWLFRYDGTLADLTLQPEEVADAMWADASTVRRMWGEGTLFQHNQYTLDDITACCKRHWEDLPL